MVEVLSGPERRRRRTPQEKIAIIQQTAGTRMTAKFMSRACMASMRKTRYSNGVSNMKMVR